jgi:hypothetical protein
MVLRHLLLPAVADHRVLTDQCRKLSSVLRREAQYGSISVGGEFKARQPY